MLVINAAKSLTNISKGGSNKQYLTPIKGASVRLSNLVVGLGLLAVRLEDPKYTNITQLLTLQKNGCLVMVSILSV
jgi:hypothetical protein